MRIKAGVKRRRWIKIADRAKAAGEYSLQGGKEKPEMLG